MNDDKQVYEVRVLNRGEQMLHMLIPLPYAQEESYRYLYKGQVVVGQVQSPAGMQTVQANFAFEIQASNDQDAFDVIPELAAKEIAKCKAEFQKQLSQKKILTPDQYANNTAPSGPQLRLKR